MQANATITIAITIAAAALGGCTLESSLGSTQLESNDPDAPSGGGGQMPLGTIAYPKPAHALLDTPEGLLFVTKTLDGQPLDAQSLPVGVESAWGVFELLPGSPELVAEIPYKVVYPSLARDDDAIYVAVEFPDPDPYGSNVPRQGIVAIDNATRALRVVTSGWENLNSIAAGGGFVYFTQNLGRDTGRLVRIGIDGENPRVLIEDLDSPTRVRVDASYVYVADDLNHRVLAVATSGTPHPLVIADGVARPFDLGIHGEWLYIAEREQMPALGRISRVPLPPAHAQQADLATFAEVVVDDVVEPSGLAFSATHVYWTGYRDGLHRASLDGTSSELRVPSYVLGCGPIAAHGGNVYFTSRYPDNTGGLIYVDEM